MGVRIPAQFRGTLTEDEKHDLMDPDLWDCGAGVIHSPVADPYQAFEVYLGHDDVVALGQLASRKGVNSVDLV